MNCLKLPFTQFDSDYLESLPDEVFFAHRYVMDEQDKALLLENSSVIHGRRFYRAKVREPLLLKYAALTNPKEGEPGSKSNPLIRFGKEYVYSTNGDLVRYRRDMKVKQLSSLSDDQKEMIKIAAKQPIRYSDDCPKSSKVLRIR